MKTSPVTALALALLIQAPALSAQGLPRVETDVREMLERQAAGWNDGSIDDYMDHYLKSDSLSFHAGDRLIRGWDKLRSMYEEKYPAGGRGELVFDDVEIRALSAGAAYVTGRWQVRMPDETREGRFTLVVRKTPLGWKIVHDHSS